MHQSPSAPVRRLYLDNSATSFPKPPAVLEAMTQYARNIGASAGRGGYAEAVETGRLLAECRQRLCRLFHGAAPECFILTLNCTHALNQAIKGLAARGGHAVCSHIDHNSVLRPLGALEDRGQLAVSRVPICPRTGLIDPEDVRRALRPDTRMLVVTHASNVSGTLQPLTPLADLAAERGIPLLVDAAQSAGHVPLDVQAQKIDLLAAPGHKGLLGPLGTGFLYIRPGLEEQLEPLMEGGTGSISEVDRQPDFLPDRFESGSHNAIGLAGLSAGVQWVLEQGVESLQRHEAALIATFLEGIDNLPGLHLHGPPTIRDRVGVFALSIDGLEPAELAAILESRYGLLTRAGLHCAPLAHQALGTAARGGAVRLSFGPFLTTQDVNYATDALAEVALEQQRVGLERV